MRKEIRITITDEGRDKGKTFIITEMAASKAEKWAAKALLAVAHSGVELPDDVQGAGVAGIAVMGLKALTNLKFEDLEPLMDEMFECVMSQPDPARPDIKRPLVENDIEEILTRIRLRAEAFTLHTGFSLAGGPSKLNSTAPPAGS